MFDFLRQEPMEIPEIVNRKAEEAFQRIRVNEAGRRRHFMLPPAAVACLSILLVGGITVGAATFPAWSTLLKGKLYAAEEEQDYLYRSGMVAKYSEDLAVTHQGVTITPMEAVIDETSIFMTFHTEGLTMEPQNPLSFCNIDFSIPNLPEDTATACSSSWIDEEHEDFVVVAHVSGENKFQDISGKNIQVRLAELESYHHGSIHKGVSLDEEWSFDLTLPKCSPSKSTSAEITLSSGTKVNCTVWLSPISVRVRYDANFDDLMGTTLDTVDLFDSRGQEMEGLLGDGTCRFYEDATDVISNFTRVIDPETIKEIRIPQAKDDSGVIRLG